MSPEFHVIIVEEGQWVAAYCPEVPGANGQGTTKAEAIDSLKEAVLLILEDRRNDALRDFGEEAVCEPLPLG